MAEPTNEERKVAHEMVENLFPGLGALASAGAKKACAHGLAANRERAEKAEAEMLAQSQQRGVAIVKLGEAKGRAAKAEAELAETRENAACLAAMEASRTQQRDDLKAGIAFIIEDMGGEFVDAEAVVVDLRALLRGETLGNAGEGDGSSRIAGNMPAPWRPSPAAPASEPRLPMDNGPSVLTEYDATKWDALLTVGPDGEAKLPEGWEWKVGAPTPGDVGAIQQNGPGDRWSIGTWYGRELFTEAEHEDERVIGAREHWLPVGVVLAVLHRAGLLAPESEGT